jgi:hypothetical protein
MLKVRHNRLLVECSPLADHEAEMGRAVAVPARAPELQTGSAGRQRRSEVAVAVQSSSSEPKNRYRLLWQNPTQDEQQDGALILYLQTRSRAAWPQSQSPRQTSTHCP